LRLRIFWTVLVVDAIAILVSVLQVIVDVVSCSGSQCLKALVVFAPKVSTNVRRWSFSLTSLEVVIAYIKILNVVLHVVLQPPLFFLSLNVILFVFIATVSRL